MLRGGVVVERRTPNREAHRRHCVVSLSKTHLTPYSSGKIQEEMAPSQHG